jgi:hypothetical protein
MKFITSFCRTVAMFVMLLSVCNGLAVCGERGIGELYTVKINDIPFRRDVAADVLLRINCNYTSEGIRAYDNVKKADISLTGIEKNMDINIRDNFLSEISNLYKNRLNKDINSHRKISSLECIGSNMDFASDKKTIEICFDTDDGKISYLMASYTR